MRIRTTLVLLLALMLMIAIMFTPVGNHLVLNWDDGDISITAVSE